MAATMIRVSVALTALMLSCCAPPPAWPTGAPEMPINVRVESDVPVSIKEQRRDPEKEAFSWKEPTTPCAAPCSAAVLMAGPDREWWLEGESASSRPFTLAPAPDARLRFEEGAPTLSWTGAGFTGGGSITILLGALFFTLEKLADPEPPLGPLFWTGVGLSGTGLLASGAGIIMMVTGRSTLTVDQQGSGPKARAPQWYLGEF